MTAITPNYVGINFKSNGNIQQKNSTPVDTKKSSSLSVSTKIGVGAGALAVAVLAGLAVHGKIKTKQLDELKGQAERTESWIRDKLAHQDEKTKALFNPELMEGHIEDAKKLPLKEQVKELKKINEYAGTNYHTLFESLSAGEANNIWLKPPKLSKEILDTKDQYLIVEEHCKLMQNRLFDSKTQGKTIQETVENIFGKSSEIKPHTYDLSKEADSIGTQETIGGFKTFMATKDGKYDYLGLAGCRVKSHPDIVKSQGHEIVSQKVDGKPVVYMDVYDDALNTGNRQIWVVSPNNEMTPMQKDLLSLNGKLTPEDINVYKDIFGRGKNINHDDPLALFGDRNYDGIASFIQSMAEKYR